MQRIVQACLPDDERGQVTLPGWMRAYAAAAWQDRFFAEQNFTPLQQVFTIDTLLLCSRLLKLLPFSADDGNTLLACACIGQGHACCPTSSNQTAETSVCPRTLTTGRVHVQSVCRALADQGISYEERQLHNMTFAVVVLGTQIALHPEGPDNFSSSWPKRPLGETLAMRRMLSAQGWTVIPVPKHEWMAMSIPRRRAHVAKLVADASS